MKKADRTMKHGSPNQVGGEHIKAHVAQNWPSHGREAFAHEDRAYYHGRNKDTGAKQFADHEIRPSLLDAGQRREDVRWAIAEGCAGRNERN